MLFWIENMNTVLDDNRSFVSTAVRSCPHTHPALTSVLAGSILFIYRPFWVSDVGQGAEPDRQLLGHTVCAQTQAERGC